MRCLSPPLPAIGVVPVPYLSAEQFVISVAVRSLELQEGRSGPQRFLQQKGTQVGDGAPFLFRSAQQGFMNRTW